MILLLNYLPYILVALGIWLTFYFAKKHKGTDKVGKRIVTTWIAVIVAWFILLALSNGYIPKGSVPRIEVPDYTVDPNAENAPKVENRLLNTAKPKEQAKADFDSMVDWRAAKAAREKKVNSLEEENKDTQRVLESLELPPKQ